MARQQYHHMHYQPGMEEINSDMLAQVLKATAHYAHMSHRAQDVEHALRKSRLDLKDFASLLSASAEPYLEDMAQRSRQETARHFGNAIGLFTPLYIANYCENECVYCGFNCKNRIRRARLDASEIRREFDAIARTGLKEILILSGEARKACSPQYIAQAVQIAREFFPVIGLEVYPLNTHEYREQHACGADFVSVYQETYDPVCYEQKHLNGSKRSFPYRFYAQERAVLGGMRGVAFGSLLGLGDFRRDAFAAGLHAMLLQQKYPHIEVSFSFPRLRPYINHADYGPNDVGERQLLQVMLAYRLFMPFAGLTISTREQARFRDNVIGLAATKISAGVKVSVGGHDSLQKGDGQFDISDDRSVADICQMIRARGLQPVFKDHIHA